MFTKWDLNIIDQSVLSKVKGQGQEQHITETFIIDGMKA